MATKTTNLELTKPLASEYYDVSVFNDNADLIDAAVNKKADKASPTFTGAPKAPTPAAGANDTQLATTAFVQSAVSGKADKASPTFTGTPKAPTPAADTNNTQIATTAFVQGLVDDLKDSVSDGKTALASAITDKGVSTGSSDSFDTMAANIRSIVTNPPEGREWGINDSFSNYNSHNKIIFVNGKFHIYSNKYLFGGNDGRAAHLLIQNGNDLNNLTFLDKTSLLKVDGVSYNNEVNLDNIVCGNGLLLASSNTGYKIYKSLDGVNWEYACDMTSNVGTLSFINNHFFAIYNLSRIIKYSVDGITWSMQEFDEECRSNIVYGNGIYLCITEHNNGPVARRSTDLQTWQGASIPVESGMYSCKIYFDEIVGFILSNQKYILRSSDGITWEIVFRKTIEFTPTKIIKGNGKYIIIGQTLNGTGSNVTYNWSKNGYDWSEMTFGTAVIKDIEFKNNVFVACGVSEASVDNAYGIILFSRTTNDY